MEASGSLKPFSIGHQDALTIKQMTLLKSYESVIDPVKMAVSRTGTIAYISSDGNHPLHYSLFVLKGDIQKTVISKTSDFVGGITFLQVGDQEHLLIYQKPNIVLLDSNDWANERRLQMIPNRIIHFSKSGPNKVVYLKSTDKRSVKELRELEVTEDSVNDIVIAELNNMKSFSDMCKIGDLLILTSAKIGIIKAVRISDLEVIWKADVSEPWNPCPGTPGSVLVACPTLNAVLQLSLRDGAILTQLPLQDVAAPFYVYNHNDTFYIAHYDANIYMATKGSKTVPKISQFKCI